MGNGLINLTGGGNPAIGGMKWKESFIIQTVILPFVQEVNWDMLIRAVVLPTMIIMDSNLPDQTLMIMGLNALYVERGYGDSMKHWRCIMFNHPNSDPTIGGIATINGEGLRNAYGSKCVICRGGYNLRYYKISPEYNNYKRLCEFCAGKVKTYGSTGWAKKQYVIDATITKWRPMVVLKNVGLTLNKTLL